MKDLAPTPRDQRPPIPDFAPVPRTRPRHDGWTPERQRAFIEALADTGSVTTACRMVNMASEGAYALRRHPEAAGFRAAWNAALDMGVLRLKDEAFDRALNGQLVPVFVAGKLAGYRRKKNDRLLMFCLRHYGEDAAGRRVTLNLIQAIANAQSGTAPATSGVATPGDATPGDATSIASASSRAGDTAFPLVAGAMGAHPLPFVPSAVEGQPPSPDADKTPARAERSATTLADFPPVALTEAEQAQIQAILEAAAARRHQTDPADDPHEPYIPADSVALHHPDAINPLAGIDEACAYADEADEPWETLHRPDERAAIAEAVRQVKEAKARAAASAPPMLAAPAAQIDNHLDRLFVKQPSLR